MKPDFTLRSWPLLLAAFSLVFMAVSANDRPQQQQNQEGDGSFELETSADVDPSDDVDIPLEDEEVDEDQVDQQRGPSEGDQRDIDALLASIRAPSEIEDEEQKMRENSDEADGSIFQRRSTSRVSRSKRHAQGSSGVVFLERQGPQGYYLTNQMLRKKKGKTILVTRNVEWVPPRPARYQRLRRAPGNGYRQKFGVLDGHTAQDSFQGFQQQRYQGQGHGLRARRSGALFNGMFKVIRDASGGFSRAIYNGLGRPGLNTIRVPQYEEEEEEDSQLESKVPHFVVLGYRANPGIQKPLNPRPEPQYDAYGPPSPGYGPPPASYGPPPQSYGPPEPEEVESQVSESQESTVDAEQESSSGVYGEEPLAYTAPPAGPYSESFPRQSDTSARPGLNTVKERTIIYFLPWPMAPGGQPQQVINQGYASLPPSPIEVTKVYNVPQQVESAQQPADEEQVQVSSEDESRTQGQASGQAAYPPRTPSGVPVYLVRPSAYKFYSQPPTAAKYAQVEEEESNPQDGQEHSKGYPGGKFTHSHQGFIQTQNPSSSESKEDEEPGFDNPLFRSQVSSGDFGGRKTLARVEFQGNIHQNNRGEDLHQQKTEGPGIGGHAPFYYSNVKEDGHEWQDGSSKFTLIQDEYDGPSTE